MASPWVTGWWSPVADALAIDNLRFAYRRGGDELFGGLTHRFTPGAVTAITGASGQGKSTLLYLLGLLLSPTAGSVTLGGVDVSGAPDDQRSRVRATRIGFVFQDAALDPTRTVLDAVVEAGLYGGQTLGALRTRAMELLDQFGVAHRAGHRPGQISGGQAQRVALCRALVTNPDFILADEPTGNLDQENAEVVLVALARAAASGCSVVVATHDAGVVGRCDDVLRL